MLSRMSEPTVRALQLLLGPQAAPMFNAVVGVHGASLTSVQVADAHVAPSGGVRVRFTATVRRADGTQRGEVLVAATGDIPPGAAILVGDVDGAQVEVGVWRWPHDPMLPGLAAASHPDRIAEILVDAGEQVATTKRVTVRGYRPGQRAVLEVFDGRRRWFVKVVPPEAVAGLRLRHEMLGGAVPVPPLVTSLPDGILVLPQAEGTLMRDAVSRGDAVPAVAALQELLDGLPDDLVLLPARPGHLDRVAQSVRVLGLCSRETPGFDDGWRTDLAVIVDEFRSLPGYSAESSVAVHGDFHDGQVLVAGRAVSAVIDVDTAGRGERADEWATMLGHLSVRGLTCPRAGRYGEELLAHAQRRVGADDLRARTAAVVLGLATGPFRTQQQGWQARTVARLELARRWLSTMRTSSSSVPAALMSGRDRCTARQFTTSEERT